MNRLFKFLSLGVVVALLGVAAMSVMAQDDLVEPSAPGEGGVIVEANLGSGDPPTFNPITSGDSASSDVIQWMYPDITALDPATLVSTPGAASGLAESWEYDETGTVLTLNLRQDMFWSDGTQITAADWIWAVDAVRSGTTSSPRTSSLYQLDDGTVAGGPIHSVEALDDFTIEVRLGVVARDDAGEVMLDADGNPELIAACDALEELNDIAVVPSHVFSEAFGEDYAAMDSDPYFFPSTDNGPATFGPFTDPFLEFGVLTSLIADQNFTDTSALDYVAPGEWIYQNVADSNVEYERFLAGDFTISGISANNQNDFRALADETGDFNYVEYPGNGYVYIGLNQADPNNAQAGADEDGNVIDQGIHPVFGDVLVRQAFAHAVNTAEIIGTQPTEDSPATGILEGNGYAIATHDHAVFSETSDIMAENGVAPREYDPELAMSLLEEAGWVDTDGDGIRNCQGCLYATEVDPSYEGSDLTFALVTNAGNVLRESIGETVTAQLAEVGFNVDFQANEWGNVLDGLYGQSIDALIIGWSLGLPWQPSGTMRAFFSISNDLPGSGFNYISYSNPEFDALLDEADSLAGCDPDERNALYAQAQQMLFDDQVYVFLYYGNTMVAAQSSVENFDPLPYASQWNIDDWVISSDG